MTILSSSIPAPERERLENCVREPIRRPGSVQPHGVLLTAEKTNWSVVQASGNSFALLRLHAGALLGRSVAELIGEDGVDQLMAVLAGAHGAANPVPVEVDGRLFDAVVHEVDGVVVLELEPALPSAKFSSAPAVYAAMNRLSTATSQEQLWASAAQELHALSGFDRVMIYHFHPDGHGQVVAEKLADGTMEPYLGLHYPASDIPAQARELYVAKLSRTIFSTDAVSFPLLPAESPVTGKPLDFSSAELRSVSPHHLQFMRNMGQASTVSFSLVFNGALIGMITCAHRTPRRLPYTLRHGLEVLSNQVALQLNAMSEISRLTREAEFLRLRNSMVGQFNSSGDRLQSLLHGPVTILDLVPAAVAALRLDGRISTVGDAPDATRIDRLVEQLRAGGDLLPFVCESLASEHPELAGIVPSVAGVLIVPFGGEGDYLAWFRPEITKTTRWLGNPSESNRDTTLSPRNSFSAWSESVSGKAEPWRGLDREAIEFGRDLDSALMRSAESTLAHLGQHDALTGLPNRRLLMDRLEHALVGHAPRGDVALLFVDIDAFKAINDSLGHDKGDAVLERVAERILSATRAADTVARLGGDEFVVLCADTDRDAVMNVAERVLVALHQPLALADHDLRVTASIGVAMAQDGDTAVELIRRADASMYRAKRSGKDRVAG